MSAGNTNRYYSTPPPHKQPAEGYPTDIIEKDNPDDAAKDANNKGQLLDAEPPNIRLWSGDTNNKKEGRSISTVGDERSDTEVIAQQMKAHSIARMIRPIVVSGPSGGGKSTILKKAFEQYPEAFAFSVSHTTRQPRPGEQDGKDYWFVERERMQRMIDEGEFLESAQFGGNLYGTSKHAVIDVQNTGRICILDVELQGVRNIKTSHLSAKYILVRPPDLETLEQRLRDRLTETEESLEKRLKHARDDLAAVARDPRLFDHVIVNDKLDVAYSEFLDVIAEELDSYKKSRREHS